MINKYRILLATLYAIVLIISPLFQSAVTASPIINEYPAAPNSAPGDITTGPDGNLWFANTTTGISKMSTSGTVLATYSLNSILSPRRIVAGPDGALWFTLVPPSNAYAGAIGRITTSGSITMYPLPVSHSPLFITTGPDGNLWFTDNYNDGTNSSSFIGTITMNGNITEYPYNTPTSCPALSGITTGSDGNLWVAENASCIVRGDGPAIAKITTSGVVTRYPIPSQGGVYAEHPYDITTGPDGALWFTDTLDGGYIGRITTSGNITEYATTTHPYEITSSGSDGALWFTGSTSNEIGRITVSGSIQTWTVPTGSSSPWGITSGPDGAMWFTEYSVDQVGRITTYF